ncbi:MAG: metallophosphoesterase [Clostridiaceae bacterium]
MVKNIGIVSDTHGLLRPFVLEAFKDCDLIIHAGDIGSKDIINELNKITKVVSVKGNIDKEPLSKELCKSEIIEIDGISIYVIHDISQIEIEPLAAGINLVIFGHSHEKVKLERNGIMYINPGSAGPKRFNLPTSVAVLSIEDGKINNEFISL